MIGYHLESGGFDWTYAEVQGQGAGRFLDLDGQGGWGIFKHWTIFMDVMCVSSLIKTYYLTKNENETKKTLTQLSCYRFEKTYYFWLNKLTFNKKPMNTSPTWWNRKDETLNRSSLLQNLQFGICVNIYFCDSFLIYGLFSKFLQNMK